MVKAEVNNTHCPVSGKSNTGKITRAPGKNNNVKYISLQSKYVFDFNDGVVDDVKTALLRKFQENHIESPENCTVNYSYKVKPDLIHEDYDTNPWRARERFLKVLLDKVREKNEINEISLNCSLSFSSPDYFDEDEDENEFDYITLKLRKLGFSLKSVFQNQTLFNFILYWGHCNDRVQATYHEKRTQNYFSSFDKIDPFQLTDHLGMEYAELFEENENAYSLIKCEKLVLDKVRERNKIGEVYLECQLENNDESDNIKIKNMLLERGFNIKEQMVKDGWKTFILYWSDYNHDLDEGTFIRTENKYFNDFKDEKDEKDEKK